MKLFCNSCRQYTNHKVVQSYRQTYRPEDNPNMQIDYAEGTWEIIECAGCELVSFRKLFITSEDWSPDRGPEETRYPEADPDQLDVKLFFHAPDKIDRIYRESIQSFNIGNYILCAIGLRAVIEGICEDAKNNLEKKLRVFMKKGFCQKHMLRFYIHSDLLGTKQFMS